MPRYLCVFNATAPPQIYTLSLHDALPISETDLSAAGATVKLQRYAGEHGWRGDVRSEEHTSELQSPYDLVCRLLLEKKKEYETGLEIQKGLPAHGTSVAASLSRCVALGEA